MRLLPLAAGGVAPIDSDELTCLSIANCGVTARQPSLWIVSEYEYSSVDADRLLPCCSTSYFIAAHNSNRMGSAITCAERYISIIGYTSGFGGATTPELRQCDRMRQICSLAFVTSQQNSNVQLRYHGSGHSYGSFQVLPEFVRRGNSRCKSNVSAQIRNLAARTLR